MKYKLWNKKDNLVTPEPNSKGKQIWTPEEYIEQVAPWAGLPGAKAIICDTDGPMNCGVFMEFYATVGVYKDSGMEVPEGASDEEILAIMSAFEKCPPGAGEPSTEERIAASLEFLCLVNM
jgi:hypothetical protein